MLVVKVCILLFGSILGEELQVIEESEDESELERYSDVCYGDLGCFNMSEPWWSVFRPLPPPASPEEINVKLRFFSRPNTQEEYLIDPYPEVIIGKAPFDSNKSTVIITHGFVQNGHDEWLHQMKDGYLKRVDANVMIADWGPGAEVSSYLQAAANTRVVGKVLARFLNYLKENRNLDVRDIHLIGHCLGAQISSYAAKETPGVGRLTALDPAQPGFEDYDKEVRLDKTDADFVDVIHTDGKPGSGFGMVKPYGHVDFYVNGGFDQPGCGVTMDAPVKPSLYGLKNDSIFSREETCNHRRSYEYMTEAITGDCIFWGRRKSYSSIMYSILQAFGEYFFRSRRLLGYECNPNKCVPIGLDTPNYSKRGTFLVRTSSKSPFCLKDD